MLDRDDPGADAAQLIRGYHSVRRPTDLERELLPELILARLCGSVLHSADGLHRAPENAYLQVSATPVWRLLESLAEDDGTRLSRAVELGCR